MWPFSKKYPKSLSSIQIELFETINRGKTTRIVPLINRYNDVIRHEFHTWTSVPSDIRGDKHWESWYTSGLIGLADIYKQCGVPTFIDQLMGPPVDNPIARWTTVMSAAQTALNEKQPGIAATLIEPVIAEMLAVSGTAVDKYLPMCHGKAGAAYFAMGNTEDALVATQRALTACKASYDAEGVVIYTNNLKRMRGGHDA